MVQAVFKSSLDKNVWQIDTEAGTYQDRGGDHDPLEPCDVSSHLCYMDLDIHQAGVSLCLVHV